MYKGKRICRQCKRRVTAENHRRHRDAHLAQRKTRRDTDAQHRIDRAAANKAWRNSNRGHCNQYNRIKKARKRAAGTLTLNEWIGVLERYGSLCLACGSDAPPTIDHVIPLINGGPNTVDNVQPLCGPCNSSKGTNTVDYRPDQQQAP